MVCLLCYIFTKLLIELMHSVRRAVFSIHILYLSVRIMFLIRGNIRFIVLYNYTYMYAAEWFAIRLLEVVSAFATHGIGKVDQNKL